MDFETELTDNIFKKWWEGYDVNRNYCVWSTNWRPRRPNGNHVIVNLLCKLSLSDQNKDLTALAKKNIHQDVYGILLDDLFSKIDQILLQLSKISVQPRVSQQTLVSKLIIQLASNKLTKISPKTTENSLLFSTICLNEQIQIIIKDLESQKDAPISMLTQQLNLNQQREVDEKMYNEQESDTEQNQLNDEDDQPDDDEKDVNGKVDEAEEDYEAEAEENEDDEENGKHRNGDDHQDENRGKIIGQRAQKEKVKLLKKLNRWELREQSEQKPDMRFSNDYFKPFIIMDGVEYNLEKRDFRVSPVKKLTENYFIFKMTETIRIVLKLSLESVKYLILVGSVDFNHIDQTIYQKYQDEKQKKQKQNFYMQLNL